MRIIIVMMMMIIVILMIIITIIILVAVVGMKLLMIMITSAAIYGVCCFLWFKYLAWETMHCSIIGFLVSKETVVLRRWER